VSSASWGESCRPEPYKSGGPLSLGQSAASSEFKSSTSSLLRLAAVIRATPVEFAPVLFSVDYSFVIYISFYSLVFYSYSAFIVCSIRIVFLS